MNQNKIFFQLIPYVILLLLGVQQSASYAQESSFRAQFTHNYKSFDFKRQEKLLEKSGGILSIEIRSLIDEAMSQDKTLSQRMDMLDVANAMANGYVHYHGEGKELVKEIGALIQREFEKERERINELTKWDKDEKFLGNFVMKENIEQMEKEGVAPVIYPHWIHRIWFECRVCHDDLFPMRRVSSKNSHEEMQAGKSCGVCHNGELAFASDGKCDNCHLAGKPEAKKLQSIKDLDHAHIKEVAEHMGAEWNIENLPAGRIPVDRYGFIDWLELQGKEVSKPVNNLGKESSFETRDNKIFFVSKSKLKNVIFDHEIHTARINCLSCHPKVFSEDLKNDVKMVKMSKGGFCGLCHGKVSFAFSDCLRCHSSPKGEIVDGVLLHLGKPDKKGLQ